MPDPDDLIFPRAATRIGHKYQVAVPLTKDEPIPRSSGSVSVVSERSEGAQRSFSWKFVSSSLDLDVIRGGSETIETLGLINHFSEPESKPISVMSGFVVAYCNMSLSVSLCELSMLRRRTFYLL